MAPTFAYGQQKRIYRYYVASALLPGRTDLPACFSAVRRVPAQPLEDLVLERLRRWAVAPGLEWPAARRLLKGVTLRAEAIDMCLDAKALMATFGVHQSEVEGRLSETELLLSSGAAEMKIRLQVRPRFRGGRVSTLGAAAAHTRRPQFNAALVGALRSAHQQLHALNASPLDDDIEIAAEALAPADFYGRKLAPLAFMAPDIQQWILQGRQPAGLTLDALLACAAKVSWADQRLALGRVSSTASAARIP